ncbi:MAG: hydroxymethylglutaryl-CoA lyase [Burkholderiales bacterium]|uniref:hydroxymethylglutaryl-CoA lyase n=1 Tax=Polaromonas sp. TaxID=1869339 RepID=UPI00352A5996|nr:hydroxymethylglutaryl-CoA lyase [Burkholderiales bacterium]
MSDLPASVEFHEEGPREGFQMEQQTYPLADRAALIDALAASGLKQIQVASFVSPRAVPQMADTSELFAAIAKRPGTRYTALWLNDNGFERARACEQVDLDGKLMFYTTEPFSQRNNNCSVAEMRERQLGWLDRYIALGIPVEKAYVITAFGCNLGGAVPLSAVTDQVRWLVDACADRGVPLPAVYLADTMGWANPEDIKRRIGAVREIVPDTSIGLHLHDTRGVGGANVYAALQMGVRLFDSSVAGLGGCPFAGHKQGGAAGNICTEDMVFMCHELGIETGIDLDALIEAARLAERIIGRTLVGHVMHSGSLTGLRSPAAQIALP